MRGNIEGDLLLQMKNVAMLTQALAHTRTFLETLIIILKVIQCYNTF